MLLRSSKVKVFRLRPGQVVVLHSGSSFEEIDWAVLMLTSQQVKTHE